MQQANWILKSLALCLALCSAAVRADSVEQINANTEKALGMLLGHSQAAYGELQNAAGVLVFPDIFKLGFGVGGQYGEGVLLVEGEPVAYYTTANPSFGLQPGHHFKTEVIVFRTEEALQQFQQRRGFLVGRDGTVALPEPGEAGGMLSSAPEESVVGFIFSDKGMVADLSMDGSRITRMAR